MSAFRRGAGHAYEAVYERFAEGLCLFADKLVKDRLLAEDIAVEALAKSFRKHTDFETLDKLKSFLFTAANNAALDQLKIRKRHNRAHGEILYLKEGEMDDAELAYIRTEAVQAVQDAINALPGQPRQVIRMIFLEGKKLPEIAAELNLSYNTVQNHRARGLEMMRIHLQKNNWLSSAGVWLAFSLLANFPNGLDV